MIFAIGAVALRCNWTDGPIIATVRNAATFYAANCCSWSLRTSTHIGAVDIYRQTAIARTRGALRGREATCESSSGTRAGELILLALKQLRHQWAGKIRIDLAAFDGCRQFVLILCASNLAKGSYLLLALILLLLIRISRDQATKTALQGTSESFQRTT